jgi:hypothetical protein
MRTAENSESQLSDPVRAGSGATWHAASSVTNQCVGLRIHNNAVVMGIGDSISDENGMQPRSAFVQSDEHCTAFGMKKICYVFRSSKFSPSFYSPIGRGRIDLRTPSPTVAALLALTKLPRFAKTPCIYSCQIGGTRAISWAARIAGGRSASAESEQGLTLTGRPFTAPQCSVKPE